MGKSIFNSDLNMEVSLLAKSSVHPPSPHSMAEAEEPRAERGLGYRRCPDGGWLSAWCREMALSRFPLGSRGRLGIVAWYGAGLSGSEKASRHWGSPSQVWQCSLLIEAVWGAEVGRQQVQSLPEATLDHVAKLYHENKIK